jgi:hypothetical protein
MEFKNGKLSTTLICLVLAGLVGIIGYLIQFPQTIAYITGASIYAKVGGFILAVLIVGYDQWTPRIKAMMEGQDIMVLDKGAVIAFSTSLTVIVATAIVLNPDVLNPILGDKFAPFLPVIVGALTIYAKVDNPRNQNISVLQSSIQPKEEQPPADSGEGA